jgi:glutathione-specific gamma-glutamylcyclotransferase
MPRLTHPKLSSNSNQPVVIPKDEYIWAEWVFAYGSLIWNPEIEFESAHLGKVFGKHRSFCVQSTMYRGTPSEPGVVLGLDHGGSCIGIAYKLTPESKTHSIEKLYAREMPLRIYIPTLVNVHLQGSNEPEARVVKALTFVANRCHQAYLSMSDEQLLGRLRHCVGDRGANKDYALNTWEALKARGVHDHRLDKIASQLLALECVIK